MVMESLVQFILSQPKVIQRKRQNYIVLPYRQKENTTMSKFGFNTIEHALASVAHDTVVGARAVASASAKVTKAEPTIEDITALIDPPAAVIERAAFAALGSLAKAANDTATAATDKGLNVPLDAQTIQEYRQLFKTLVTQLEALNKPAVAASKASASTPAERSN
jgi:hypothetical protein